MPILGLAVTFQGLSHYEQTDDDLLFEERLKKVVPRSIQKLVYTKIAGVTYANADGTARLPFIETCEYGQPLDLRSDPGNQLFPDAVAIEGPSGQLGFGESRLAGEMLRDARANGPNWLCIFRRHSHHPVTGAVVGGLVCMVRLESEIGS